MFELNANGMRLSLSVAQLALDSIQAVPSDFVWSMGPAQGMSLAEIQSDSQEWKDIIAEEIASESEKDRQERLHAIVKREAETLLNVSREYDYTMPSDELRIKQISTGQIVARIFNLYNYSDLS